MHSLESLARQILLSLNMCLETRHPRLARPPRSFVIAAYGKLLNHQLLHVQFTFCTLLI